MRTDKQVATRLTPTAKSSRCVIGRSNPGMLDHRVFIDVDVQNKRVYVRGRRLHHGLIGAVAIVAGVVCAVHDRRDAKVWIKDFVDRR